MSKRKVQETQPTLTREMRDDLISRHLGAASISTRLGCHRLIDALLPALRDLSAPPTAAAEKEQAESESQCANCGKPASEAAHCIAEYPEEGEWFCSDACFEQHGILDCPHVTHSGYRHPAEAQRLIAAERVLHAVAALLGCEVPGSEDLSAADLEQQIRERVEGLLHGQAEREGGGRAHRLPLFWVRPRSDGGYDGPISDDAIEDVRKNSGAWVALTAAEDGTVQRAARRPITDRMVVSALDAFNGYPCPPGSTMARCLNDKQMAAAIRAAIGTMPDDAAAGSSGHKAIAMDTSSGHLVS